MRRRESLRLRTLRVLPRAGRRGARLAGRRAAANRLRARAGGNRRDKREGDGATPAGRFRLLWGYYRPDRRRPPAGGVPLQPLRRDQGWCEDPASGRYNRPVRLPPRSAPTACGATTHLYDLVFVLDHNFTRRVQGARQRDLLPSRAPRPDADRRLRRHFRRRHAQARAAAGARR